MKKIVTTPFDRFKVPPKQNPLFMPFFWAYCYFVTRGAHLKIHKVNMEGLKPPYIVLGSHHSFMDFIVSPLAVFPHRANYVSELEGFEYYGEWVFRQFGCLGTRKFVNDLALVRNIRRVLDRKGILILYPEARYANVGTNSKLPVSVAKLLKNLKVPVVVLNMQGNYLQSPIWNLTKRKEARLEATIKQVFTREQLASASLDEIYATISRELTYDDYEYQFKNQMSITYEKRAEGLHKVLYQCPKCRSEFTTSTSGASISCSSCGMKYTMNEYGRLVDDCLVDERAVEGRLDDERLADESGKCPTGDGTGVGDNDVVAVESRDCAAPEFTKIPDWYEWQRARVIESIDAGTYGLDCRVRIESLPNAVNFIDLGEGRLVHKKEGFYLTLKDYGCSELSTRFFSAASMTSIHTEYDYRGKGQCVTLSDVDNTYFIYPLDPSEGFNATKIQFATEYLYELASVNKKNKQYK